MTPALLLSIPFDSNFTTFDLTVKFYLPITELKFLKLVNENYSDRSSIVLGKELCNQNLGESKGK